MQFNELIEDEALIEAISYMGFKNATEIQEKAIPEILNKKDLLACAQTGTGKTAAFVLPLLSLIRKSPNTGSIKALIVVPTRELAMQIDQEIQGIAYFLDVNSIAIYGGGDGVDWNTERTALVKGVDIVVATPGRLISHLNLGSVDFKSLDVFILDEADKMLDMGFFDDIVKISTFLSENHQTLMFSATMPPKIRQLTRKLLKNPIEINLNLSKPAEGVEQKIYPVLPEHKVRLIHHILSSDKPFERVIIFTSTKSEVRTLVSKLKQKGHNVNGISSDLEQNERENVLRDFKAGNLNVLVATDVLSRGIDIKNIHLVINYSVPSDAEDYVHRVGRTARADKTGVAITLVTPDKMQAFNDIEQLIETKLEKLKLPFAPEETPEWKVVERKKKYYRKSRYKRNPKSRHSNHRKKKQ